jgi:ABC-2 type transport system permease protein/bacitracin transport system permease protein
MFLVWILILTVVTSLSTLVLGFIAGLDGFSLKLFIDSFAQLLFASVLLFLTFSPFVFLYQADIFCCTKMVSCFF